MKRSRSRIAAVVGLVGVFPALVVLALIALEFTIPADGLRARAAAVLSDALGCPLTIAGSLHIVTGTQPGIEGRDVRLEECRPIRVTRASADRVRVRVDLWALFSREIRLVEIAGERLETEVPTAAPSATPPAAPSGEPSRWTFTEITRLSIAPVRVLIRSTAAAPHLVDLLGVDGSAQTGQPMRLTLRGSHAGEGWQVTVATAALRDAIAGQKRWPLDLAAEFAGANGTLRGSWTTAPLSLEADLALKTAAAERLLKAIGAEPPELGPLELTTKLAAFADRVNLDGIQFAGPVGAISGEARAEMKDGRPTLNVKLSADEIDYAALNRWRSVQGGSGSPEETVARALARLRSFDGALVASFKHITHAPFPATDAHSSARLDAGQLKISVSATIDGAPGEAAIEIDARSPFAVLAHASVKALPRTAVTQARGVAKLDPRIGGLRATFSAHGTTAAELFKEIKFGLTGKDIRFLVPWPDDRGEVRLRTVELRGESRKAFHANAAGTFAGEPLAFELASAPPIDLFENRPWTIERVRARVGAAELSAKGRIEPPHDARAARFSFDLSVSRLDRLAPLLGGAALPRVPGSVRGSFDFSPKAWRIDATTLAIGATRGSGTAASKQGASLGVTLDLDRIAADELAAVQEKSRPRSERDAVPTLADLDLSLKARSAQYAGENFETIAVDVRVRDGAAHAPFSVRWAGAPVEGVLNAKAHKESMQIGGDATVRELDVARLPGPLAKQGITGKIDRLTVRFEARGASPAALQASAAISVEVADASMILPRSDALPEGARVTFGGKVEAPAAAPIDFSVNGAFREKPFTASGQLPPLDRLFPAGKRHAVRLAIDYDRSRLEASGNATLDKDTPRFSGSLTISGDTLHTLADLAGFSAPGFGPYKVSATVDADSKQVAARDLAMRLGKSEFRASLAAETHQARPRIAAKVQGLPVHLEDIGAQAWSPENLEKRAVERTTSSEKFDQATLDRDARLLTRILRAFDLDLDVTFDEVSAAGEKVGRAELKANLADGRLIVNPASLWIDQGKFSAEIEVDVRRKVPQYVVKFEGTGFDYGPLMLAVDPKSPHHGTLDLSMDFKTSGVPETLAQNATGTFDVLVLPRGQEAGSLGVLGAGVLRLLLRTLDPRSQSQLNCIVGSFDMDKGVATSRIVLLDTTLARVAGELVIDYRTRALKGSFAPRSKQPQLFSVAPGINVGGTLDAPDIGVSTQSVVLGALRIWQFPIAFAADWLKNENIPADGTPGCRAAYRHVLH